MLVFFSHIGAAIRFTGVPPTLFEQLTCDLLATQIPDGKGGQSAEAVPFVQLIENSTLRPLSVRGHRLTVVRTSGSFEVRHGGGRLRLRSGSPVNVEVPLGLSAEEARRITLPLLRAALFRALGEHGFSVLHAGAFEIGGRGFVVVGESGAGKTTLAMIALRAGGRVVSDDSLLAGVLPGGGAGVAAFRRDAVLRDAGERLVPSTFVDRLYRASFEGVERAVLRRAAVPHAFTAVTTPGVLFLPRVDRRRRITHLVRAGAAEGLAALIAASSPAFLAPELGSLRARLLPALVRIAGACAVYRVALGRDLLTDPDAVASRLFFGGDT